MNTTAISPLSRLSMYSFTSAYMGTSTGIYIVAAILLIFLYVRCNFPTGRHLPLPPGPTGSYFSGIKNSLPRAQPWKAYASWSQIYNSPVISFRVYNRTIVVLNTLSSIHTLLNDRSHIYSDRPMSWMYNVICGRGLAVFNVSSSGSTRHRTYRRMLQSGLGKKATGEAWGIMLQEVGKLVDGLDSQPEEWQRHIRRNAAGVIMRVAFGYSIESLDDPFIKVADETSKISGLATAPGRWLVDYYPILRFVPSFFPGAEWKRQGLKWKERLRYLSDVPHTWVKEKMEKGVHVDSFTSNFLHPDSSNETLIREGVGRRDNLIKWCAGGLYAGAADTTVSALVSFVLLMAMHPEVQRKAQDEVDEIAGHAHKASWSRDSPSTLAGESSNLISDIKHLESLAYLSAIMKEVLRFAPVGNLALPHSNSEEDEFMGYRIPKGSTIMANVWAIMHDEELYPEPFKFDPDRFVSKRSSQPDPSNFAFGFGRRACPGKYFAETTMLLAMANVVGHFDISVKDCDRPRAETLEFTTGITSHIVPFPVTITCRRRTAD